MKKKIISIVIPVCNEEENVLTTYNKIKNVLNECNSYDHEIIFTDNCSQDKTFSLLEQISAEDKCVKVIRFSKNFSIFLFVNSSLGIKALNTCQSRF